MRWVFRLVGLVVVIVIAGVGALFLIPSETLGRIVSSQLTAQMGREVTVQDVSVSIFPVAGVRTEGLSIANAEWSEDGPLLQAGLAQIGVDTLAALGGTLKFRSIELQSPEILLQEARDGSGNWEISAGAPGEASDSAPLPLFTLDELIIRNGTFRYDALDVAPVVARDIDLNLTWPEADGPATFTAKVNPFGDLLTLAGQLGSPLTLMDGEPVSGALAVTGPGGGFEFEGQLGLAPELQGQFTLSLKDTAAFLAGVGVPGVELPEGLGRAASGQGAVTLTRDGLFALRDGVLKLDQNQLTAEADVETRGKPKVTARVDAGALDLRGLMGGESADSGEGWPKDRLDASALAGFDGEIAISASSIDLGAFKLGASNGKMTLTNSRAVFALNQVAAYGGTTTGQFVVNNRSGLSVGGKMTVAGVELKDLLTDAAGISRLSGPANLSFDFLGSGPSVHAIMNSLSGSGSLDAGPGVISGIDLDQLMQTGNGSGGTTVFKSLTGSFGIEGGVLRNDDLNLQTPLFQIAGEGEIGLGAQNMDYLFLPGVDTAREGRGITIPVRVKGPWSGPSIRPDLSEALERNLDEEKKALEAKAKEAVNQKLEEELGVKVEEGQSVEEAVQQKVGDEVQKKVEEELGKGLLKLLGD